MAFKASENPTIGSRPYLSVTFVLSEATPPVTCPVGYYGTLSRQPAPPGTFVATAGAQAATPCASGTYQDLYGQTSCLALPIGSYVDASGAIAATVCPAGSTTASTASTSLSDCTLNSLGIVSFDASTLALSNGSIVSTWGGQTAHGTPTYFANQTPGGGPAVQFNGGGDRMGDDVSLPASAAGDWILVAVIKPNNIGNYHNLADDNPQTLPMLWIDPGFNYELNFGNGTGAKRAGTGTGGWDIVIVDLRLNQLFVNSTTPNATGGESQVTQPQSYLISSVATAVKPTRAWSRNCASTTTEPISAVTLPGCTIKLCKVDGPDRR